MQGGAWLIMPALDGKRILIVGGTGSIGQSLLRNLLYTRPSSVTIMSKDENALFELQQEYRERLNLNFVFGDIRDTMRLSGHTNGVDIIFHAAALKHVSISESNPYDAVATNVSGTINLIDASIGSGVE